MLLRETSFMIKRLASRELDTKFGTFTEMLYYDGENESIALVMGEVEGAENVLCRIHSACIGGHVFNSIECECANEMAAAQAAIQLAEKGVIIYLEQEGKGNGHLALIKSIPFKKAGSSQAEAYEKAGYKADARNYMAASAILNNLQVSSIILLTGNPAKAGDLRKESINISGTAALKS